MRSIAKNNPVAARGLRNAVAVAAGHIGRHPDIVVVRPDLADPPYRFMFLTGFPYVIVDNSGRRPPMIARIVHGNAGLAGAVERFVTLGQSLFSHTVEWQHRRAQYLKLDLNTG